jgi:hypothetical protein
MPRPIFLLLYLVLLATPCLAQTTATTVGSEIPFSLQNGLIVVEGRIKDNVSVNVVLATGTEHSVADPALLKKYELSAYYAADGPVTGRNDKTFNFTRVSDVRVGNSHARELFMRFGSVAQLSQMAGKEIFGALGADFFEGKTLQLDFKNNVLRFLEKIPPALIDSKDPNYNPTRAMILRMAPKPSDPFKKTYQVSLVKDVQVNGQKTNVLFDTGVATVLALSSSIGKKIGLEVPLENASPRQDKVTLRFESNEFPDVPVMIYAKGTSGDQHLSRFGGAVAGALFLQKFVATFDYRKGIVVLERF